MSITLIIAAVQKRTKQSGMCDTIGDTYKQLEVAINRTSEKKKNTKDLKEQMWNESNRPGLCRDTKVAGV